ncbi:hypothetical protein ABC174_27810, partial [Klebsiella michiganensis]|uniref:hypothetical protein n=1 Tax=Klebsiella michiganensis TaxID=1134687 RepID=UPI0031F68CA7
ATANGIAGFINVKQYVKRLPVAPPTSAPGCLAASGRQARLRQAAACAPASLRRTRWRGFGLSLRSDA